MAQLTPEEIQEEKRLKDLRDAANQTQSPAPPNPFIRLSATSTGDQPADLLTKDDRLGLQLGSIAAGVLSAVIGSRSGNIDPLAAGLAGMGTAFSGGARQISDIRAAASLEADRRKRLELTESAQEESKRYHKQLGEESAAKGAYYRAHQAELTQLAKDRAAKLRSDLEQNLISREEYRLGMEALARLHEGAPRAETEQEALSGQMPTGEPGRTPEQSELIRLAAQYPGAAPGILPYAKQALKPEVWSEPYEGPSGEQLQKNSRTGQVRVATSRPPAIPTGHATIHNEQTGQNKIVPIKPGEEFTPPAGWSLRAPERPQRLEGQYGAWDRSIDRQVRSLISIHRLSDNMPPDIQNNPDRMMAWIMMPTNLSKLSPEQREKFMKDYERLMDLREAGYGSLEQGKDPHHLLKGFRSGLIPRKEAVPTGELLPSHAPTSAAQKGAPGAGEKAPPQKPLTVADRDRFLKAANGDAVKARNIANKEGFDTSRVTR